MKEINKLKRKIVLIATVATVALMTLLLVTMNILNYSVVVSDADAVIDMLSKPDADFFGNENKDDTNQVKDNRADAPKGSFHELNRKAQDRTNRKMPDRRNPMFPGEMSPEVPYESRFFTVLADENGELIESDVSRIISVNDDSADTYLEKALGSNKKRGFVEGFRYKKIAENGMTRIMFLDCGRKLDAFYWFMCISIGIGVCGCLLVFIIMMFVSKKLVKPIKDSYESQRRFITDAGHEIKTPVTIINANADLLADDIGENESIHDIRVQIGRLTELTNKMISLSRMEENDNSSSKKVFSVSDVVRNAVREFAPLADTKKINYEYEVETGVELEGPEEDIRNLVSILMDNAVKYTPDNGKIFIKLKRDKKTVILTVNNSVVEALSEEKLKHLFDRFYRTDESRNSETGGNGLGLSIAQAIVNNCDGEISAACDKEGMFSISAVLPI